MTDSVLSKNALKTFVTEESCFIYQFIGMHTCYSYKACVSMIEKNLMFFVRTQRWKTGHK